MSDESNVKIQVSEQKRLTRVRKDAAIFVRLSRLFAYFNAPTPDSVTVRFDLPDHLFGTASTPIFATLIFL